MRSPSSACSAGTVVQSPVVVQEREGFRVGDDEAEGVEPLGEFGCDTLGRAARRVAHDAFRPSRRMSLRSFSVHPPKIPRRPGQVSP